MVKQKVPFNEIYDLFAIRIITNSDPEEEKADCWKVYSVVTNIYTPETSRMRDWITRPRANGYESLHITVKDITGRWVEVQVRSQRMDNDAELGNAAHWRYKGQKGTLDTSDWMNSVRQILENPDHKEDSLITKEISSKIPENIIYVFTPAGDLIKLKEGATVLDFAFELHTVIGSKCTGGRVNHKIVPIRQKLKNGDAVEIITSKNQTPNRDWLGWVVTSRAKNKIKRYLKEAEFKQAEVGKDILRRKLSQMKLPYNDENVSKLISHFKMASALELYQQLAENKIEPSMIKEALLGTAKEVVEIPVIKEAPKLKNRTSENTIIVNETAELQGFILAQCCNPVLGDDIFGFIMTGGGIKIHRLSCPNAPRLRTRYPYRIMEAQWSKIVEGSHFISTLNVSGVDQLGILNSITELLSNELKIDVRNIAFSSKGGKFEGFIKVSVRDSRHIDSLVKKIESLKGVTRVKRVH
jgi:GTP diphosphokinase / guanosine-3',5'-bis(diphosphate) 3'-diphosphatase